MDGKNRPVTYQDLLDFKIALLDEVRQMVNVHKPQKWLKSKDVIKLLGISPTTLQNMRNNDEIPFTRIGGVIYYQESAIDDYLISKSNTNDYQEK